jgi:hypothetical protein
MTGNDEEEECEPRITRIESERAAIYSRGFARFAVKELLPGAPTASLQAGQALRRCLMAKPPVREPPPPALTKRPGSGEYHRSPFFCKPVESARPLAPRVAVTRPNWA